MSESTDDTFYIGLTMAGAISAGAYTAGVLDVLFEALDRHNTRYAQRKQAEADSADLAAFAGFPRHQVKLRVISGTSAGGVSAGLSVAGLVGARDEDPDPNGRQLTKTHPITVPAPEGHSYSYSYILKPLHYVWVEALDLHRPDGAESFLSNHDLGGKMVTSALNTGHIDTAARDALTGITWTGGTYRFLSEDLDLFLTTTNLQGIPYEVGFADLGEDATNTHAMSQHSSIRHFRVSGLGTGQHRSPWLDAWCDVGIDLPLVRDVPIRFDKPVPDAPADPGPTDPLPESWSNWIRFKSAAIATGAFPVGLAPRVIEAEASDFGVPDAQEQTTGNAWPVDLLPAVPKVDADPTEGDDTRPRPRFSDDPGDTPDPGMDVVYVAVDGGVANNEPFELARYTLRDSTPEHRVGGVPPGEKYLQSNPRTAEQADRAVLMIDPFPEGPHYTPLMLEQANAMRALIPAATKLLPALINQARFKPGELLQATDRNIHSRYLLSPSRHDAAGGRPKQLGSKAIASGSFGGFGGFFDISFRAHDYMLGQMNARSFLDNHFRLSAANPILSGRKGPAPADIPRDDAGRCRVVNVGGDLLPDGAEPPVWPRIGQAQLDPILTDSESRVQAVGAKLVEFSDAGFFRQLVLGTVWSGVSLFWVKIFNGLDTAVYRTLAKIMMAELIGRDQHIDFQRRSRPSGPLLKDWERAVLVAIAEGGREPVPIRLTDEARRAAEKEGKIWVDLEKVLERFKNDVDSPGRTDLEAFLAELSDEENPRLWKAPRRGADDHRYTLDLLKPSSTQRTLRTVSSWGSRIRSALPW